jgi:hypothetical protein
MSDLKRWAKSEMKHLVFVLLILTGCAPSLDPHPNIRTQQFIDWLSIESNMGMWGNGMWPSVKLPLTASPRDIITAFYKLPRAHNIAGKNPEKIKIRFIQKLPDLMFGNDERLMYACYVVIDDQERYIALSNSGYRDRDVWMIYEYDNARLDWSLNEQKNHMEINPKYKDYVHSLILRLKTEPQK